MHVECSVSILGSDFISSVSLCTLVLLLCNQASYHIVLAMQGHIVQSFMAAMADAALRMPMEAFLPQNIANILWACGQLATPNPPLFVRFSAAAQQQMQLFNTQNLSDIAWGCSAAGFKVPVRLHFAY